MSQNDDLNDARILFDPNETCILSDSNDTCIVTDEIPKNDLSLFNNNNKKQKNNEHYKESFKEFDK